MRCLFIFVNQSKPIKNCHAHVPRVQNNASTNLSICGTKISARPFISSHIMTAPVESKRTNFLSQFRDPKTRALTKLTAVEFLNCWQHYDQDGNGFLEGAELDSFLREFVTSVIPDELGGEVMSECMFGKLKSEFMDAFDVDADGRIDISEMSEILPADESFVAIFCNEMPLSSSVEFIRIWRQFDVDNSGSIDGNELLSFLRHLMEKANKNPGEEKLKEFADTILNLFDRDGDGRLQLSEMSRLLRVKENYLRKPLLTNSNILCKRELERIFRRYDSDQNGFLDSVELDGLLKDFLEAVGQPCEEDKLKLMRQKLMSTLDETGEGRVGIQELRVLLIQGMQTSKDTE